MDVLELGIRKRLTKTDAEMSTHPYRDTPTIMPRHRTLRPLLTAAALAVAIADTGTKLRLHSRLTGHHPTPATKPTPTLPTTTPSSQPTPTPLPAPHDISGAGTV